MVRTQLYLDEALHARLKSLAARQGRSVSDLVRDALVRIYGDDDVKRRLANLEGIIGLWRDRKDIGDTAEYVRRLRKDTHRLPRRK